MSDGVKLWCFLLLIPFFAAIGHDLYANFYKNEEAKTRLEAFEIDPNAYQGSDLGYLLVTYTPEAYEKAREIVGEDRWVTWVDPVLRLYTFVVALVPATLFFIWLLISRIFDIWPFSVLTGGSAPSPRGKTGSRGSQSRLDIMDKRNAQTEFKYKRR